MLPDYVSHEGKSTEGAVPGDNCDIGNLEKMYDCGMIGPPKGFVKQEYQTEGVKFMATIYGTRKGVKSEYKLEIQKVKNLDNLYIDNKGMQLYLIPKDKSIPPTNFDQGNVNIYSDQENILKINPIKSKGARIIACPSSKVEFAIKQNFLHGLETIAIIGTGTTEGTNNTIKSRITSRQKTNPDYQYAFAQKDKNDTLMSPSGEVLVRFPDKGMLETNFESFYKANKLTGPKIRDAGFVTFKDGTTKMLDFLDESQAESVDKNKIVNEGLKEYRDPNKNIESFSVTGWAARDKTHPLAINPTAQTRTVYAFDKDTKELLGVIATPRIMFSQIPMFVKKAYGENAVGVNMDGDFYTGILDLRNMKKEMVGGTVTTRNTNMYFTNAAFCLVAPNTKSKPNLMSEEMESLAWKKFEVDRIKDKLVDPWKQLEGRIEQFKRNIAKGDPLAISGLVSGLALVGGGASFAIRKKLEK